MTTTTMLVLATALSVQSPNAETAAPTSSGVQESAATVTLADKAICKRVPQRGTRFTKRICATADQWEKQRRHNIEITREFQRADGSSKAGT